MKPTFVECEALRRIRREAKGLAQTDLPIIVKGELGTGRRTLACEIGTMREQRTGISLQVVQAAAGLSDSLAHRGPAEPLVLEDLHALKAVDQSRLTSWTKKRAVLLSATVGIEDDAAWASPLESLLSYGCHTIELPPLRDRGEDVVGWAECFLSIAHPAVTLGPSAKSAIMDRRWPGNLLELRTTIERAGVMASGTVLQAEHVMPTDSKEDRIAPLSEAVAEFKRSYVLAALKRFGGNRTRTARALGVDPRTVFRFLEDDPS